jgi:hypothetical protein
MYEDTVKPLTRNRYEINPRKIDGSIQVAVLYAIRVDVLPGAPTMVRQHFGAGYVYTQVSEVSEAHILKDVKPRTWFMTPSFHAIDACMRCNCQRVHETLISLVDVNMTYR